MDWPKLLAFVITVALGICFSEFKNEILNFATLIMPESSIDLVIVVLSARGNYLNRQAIRDTWAKNINTRPNTKDSVLLRFVVGNKACLIPEHDREDVYSCAPWRISLTEESKDFIAVQEENGSITTTEKKPSRNYGVSTVAFRVQHPVILSKLGLHDDSITDKASVKLLDAVTQNEIVSTVFSRKLPGVLVNGYRFKAVEPYLLPKIHVLKYPRGR